MRPCDAWLLGLYAMQPSGCGQESSGPESTLPRLTDTAAPALPLTRHSKGAAP